MRQTPSSRAQPQNYNLSNIRATPDNKQRQINTLTCFNHSDKQATHVLNHPQTLEKIYYCEKCSIMLASKGHNIIKIGKQNSSVRHTLHKQPVKTQRHRQVQQFMGELSYSIQSMSQKYNQIENILLQSQQHFNQLMNETTSYFRQIQEILQIQKYMSYNAILNHRAAVEAEVRFFRQSIQQQSDQLISIGSDIQNNMEAVQFVEINIYSSIIENYHQKLEQAQQLCSFQLSSLPHPTLTFPDIPKMLYSLADKISLRVDHAEPIPQPPKPPVSSRQPSRQQSCENSRNRVYSNIDDRNQGRKKLSSFVSLKKADSVNDKQIAFSFESNQQNDNNHIQKMLFDIKAREAFHPQEMIFRESLSLTQIRQNDEQFEGNRRYGGLLEQTIPIPEEVASQQSIAGYFSNTLNYSVRQADRGEQTQTLLIC